MTRTSNLETLMTHKTPGWKLMAKKLDDTIEYYHLSLGKARLTFWANLWYVGTWLDIEWKEIPVLTAMILLQCTDETEVLDYWERCTGRRCVR